MKREMLGYLAKVREKYIQSCVRTWVRTRVHGQNNERMHCSYIKR